MNTYYQALHEFEEKVKDLITDLDRVIDKTEDPFDRSLLNRKPYSGPVGIGLTGLVDMLPTLPTLPMMEDLRGES